MRIACCRSTLLAALALGLAALPAQAPASAPKPAAAKGLAEWPALEPAARDRLPGLAGQLKKDNDALRAAGRDALIALGDGAVPFLLQQVGEKELAFNTQVFLVLDRLLGPQHAALLAKEVRKNKIELRKYLMQRLCRFVDADLQPVFTAALQDKNEDVVFHARLGLAALRDRPALLALIEHSRTEWADRRAIVAEVLPAARGEASGEAIAERLVGATPAVQAAGLRLLRYVATTPQSVILKTYLASEDHIVKKEAINALRVVHGQNAIEDLSAFQAIEMAKEWLK